MRMASAAQYKTLNSLALIYWCLFLCARVLPSRRARGGALSGAAPAGVVRGRAAGLAVRGAGLCAACARLLQVPRSPGCFHSWVPVQAPAVHILDSRGSAKPNNFKRRRVATSSPAMCAILDQGWPGGQLFEALRAEEVVMGTGEALFMSCRVPDQAGVVSQGAVRGAARGGGGHGNG